MSEFKQLEQGYHQRAPQTYDGRRDCPRTPWSDSLHRGQCFEGFLADTS